MIEEYKNLLVSINVTGAIGERIWNFIYRREAKQIFQQ